MAKVNKAKNKNYAPAMSPETPYSQARRGLDAFRGAAVAEAKRWRALVCLLLGFLVLSAIGNVYLGAERKHVIHIVEVDRLGGVNYRGAVGEDWEHPEVQQNIVRGIVKRFIRQVRQVSSDAAFNRGEGQEAWNLLTGRAQEKLRRWISQDANNPDFLMERGLTRSIRLLATVQQTARSWQIDWEETTAGPDGSPVEPPQLWRAVITTVTIAPRNRKERQGNPLGLFVDDIGWDILSRMQGGS